MKKISRKQWIVGIAIAVMILLTVIVPPNRSQVNTGSTYDRTPSGYAGWYEFMSTQGVKVQRWQKPFQDLDQKLKKPITLIRIKPERDSIDYAEAEWIEKGNHLIILGIGAEVTNAPFSSVISSKVGGVKIESSRRRGYTQSYPNEQLALTGLNTAHAKNSEQNSEQKKSTPENKKLLSDEFGSIVWRSDEYKKGTFIAAITPYLAANTYQNEEGNYKFLANLATVSKTPIYVDEYIHGYKDPDVNKPEAEKSWISYLMATPLFAGLAQALVVLIIFVIAQNFRFGQAIAPDSATINNSQAYIEALSSVLQKAQRREFVWEAIAKAEQRKLQQKLGIGKQADQETTIRAWVQQTGRSASEIEHLLTSPRTKISEQELSKLLQDWQKVLTFL